MVQTPLTHLAFAIAHMAHAGQKDKAGAPYIEHPIHVAEQMDDEESTVVALLHDVMEDNHEFTAKTLLLYGIPAHMVDHVARLTRPPWGTYQEYIESLLVDPVAVKVKIADLEHNMDLSRFTVIPMEAYNLQERYKLALKTLTNAGSVALADPA